MHEGLHSSGGPEDIARWPYFEDAGVLLKIWFKIKHPVWFVKNWWASYKSVDYCPYCEQTSPSRKWKDCCCPKCGESGLPF